MSMQGEIATECTIKSIVAHIKDVLKIYEKERDENAILILKEIGNFCLTQFDWSTSDWAIEYEELFKV